MVWWFWFVMRVAAGVIPPLMCMWYITIVRPEMTELPVIILITFLVLYVAMFLEGRS